MGEALAGCEFDPSRLSVKFDVSLAADLKEISPVVARAMEVVESLGCAEGRETEIEIALREALSNAIRHGSRNDPGKRVRCCVACDAERGMLIVVRDEGTGFDPAALPSPVVGERVFASHGRGIYLINQLMDDVRFERGGTEIHMRAFPRRGSG
jgi:serine/threonine-protein kinase RsbW